MPIWGVPTMSRPTMTTDDERLAFRRAHHGGGSPRVPDPQPSVRSVLSRVAAVLAVTALGVSGCSGGTSSRPSGSDGDSKPAGKSGDASAPGGASLHGQVPS